MTSPTLTQEDLEYIDEGIRLFNQQEFWEAHEAWEQVWRKYPDSWRLFLQGLIQLAAGLHQLRRGIYHGTVKHLRNARWKLNLFPDRFLRMDVLALKNELEEILRAVERAGKENLQQREWQNLPQIRRV